MVISCAMVGLLLRASAYGAPGVAGDTLRDASQGGGR
jgi:hypothetical protein